MKPQKKFQLSSRFRRQAAFSLIEVAMAIGILSFCLVGMIGLLPVALKSSRQSIDRNCEIRMLETVRADLLKRPHSELVQESPANQTEYYFDGEGSLIPSGASMTYMQYHVTAIHSEATALPGAQNATRLVTSRITIEDKIRNQQRQSSLHLPDNGF